MAMPLRQSTASQEILLGVFVDETDAKTAETGLTVANTDIKLWKAGATTLANKNSGGATHISGGLYYAVLDAADTNTLGPLEVNVHVAGALPVRREFVVYPAVVYDSLFAGTDNLQVDAVQVSGSAPAADNLELAYAALTTGTAQAGGASSITLASGASAVNDFFNGQAVWVVGGTGAGQSNTISDYVGATKVATVETAWATQPDNTSAYFVLGRVG